MFDSNRNQNNILYKDESDEWSNTNTNKNLRIIYTLTDGGAEETKIAQLSSSQYQPKSIPNIPDDTGCRGERGFINKVMLKTS
jgi:DNA-binding PadR family transcriptional regulator